MENSNSTQKIGTLIAITLVLLAMSQTLFQFHETQITQWLARYALIALCVLMVPFCKLRDWVLIIFAAVLAAILIAKQNGMSEFFVALDRAAFFAAFIYIVTVLKEAAQRSPSVLKLGAYLANQPAGRRYYTLAFGGHITGILLNFGAISLLSPLIQRGAAPRAGATRAQIIISKNLEQQQISALIRGFTWMVMWSPTSLAQVVLFTTIPTADAHITIPMGILATFIMIYIGRLEDRARWKNAPIAGPNTPHPFPRRAAQRFAMICFLIICPTVFVSYILDVRLVIGLMAVVPVVILIWIYEQGFDGHIANSFHRAGRKLFLTLRQGAVGLGHNAMTLGLAGFIGIAASKIAPVDAFSHALETLNISDWVILICLPIVITICGQIALSPILTVVFLGSVLSQFETLPADPNLIFLSLSMGWALSMVASPNASASLLVSGVTNIPTTTLTWRWNGIYACLCYAIFAVVICAMSLILRG